jgi:hypothetical protein
MWRALSCCVLLACGPSAKRQDLREPSPVVAPSAVGAVEIAPTEIEPFRIAGDASVVPDDLDRVNLQVGTQARGRFQLCLDATGKPTSVAVTNTTGLPNYDRKIVDWMWMWAFNPILVDSKPARVCSQVTFLFEQTKPVVIQRH